MLEAIAENNPSSIFEQTLHSHDRRQIIRYLIQIDKASDAVEETVRLALQDYDWEVRVSAVIACARLQLVGLIEELLAVDMKIPARYLPNKVDRELVSGIGQVAKMIITQVKPAHVDGRNQKHQRWQKLYQCVKTPFLIIDDYISHLVFYFSTPNDIAIANEADSGQLDYRNQQYFLPNTTIEMCWISAGDYWLGNSDKSQCLLKNVTSANGFYINRFPLSDKDEELALFRQEEIKTKLLELQEVSCLSGLTIPNLQQWQMAARGRDARRYPWGWGIEEDWSVIVAASGFGLFWLEQGEWVLDEDVFYRVNQFGETLDTREKVSSNSRYQLPTRLIFTP